VNSEPAIIAMWSGPRNISTALMYSFASRKDCSVWDEPFYAFYLSNAGITHPLDREVIAAGETSFDAVCRACNLPPGAGRTVFYQKHMTHHMLPGYDRRWMLGLRNCFLIRKPERVLASYFRKRTEITIRDIGFVEQAEIFELVADHLGHAPPVIDADDILADPEAMLQTLCTSLGIAFDPAMLSWPRGPKPFDGVWAAHWYNAVWNSTGFTPDRNGTPPLPPALQSVADKARPIYEHLKAHKRGHPANVEG